MKSIVHIDLNAFFAQVEELCDPTLVGKPVAILVLQLVVQLFLQQITKHANMASVLVCLFKPQENYVQI